MAVAVITFLPSEKKNNVNNNHTPHLLDRSNNISTNRTDEQSERSTVQYNYSFVCVCERD